MSLDAMAALLIVSGLLLLGTGLLTAGIRLVAFQGVVLGLMPLLALHAAGGARAWALAGVTIGLKGAVFPWLLRRSLRVANVQRDMEPWVGYSASLGAGVLFMALAFWLASRLAGVGLGAPRLGLAAALFLMLTGFFLVIARRKALTQVLGFLVLENGLYGFGLLVAGHIHWLIELGVLLDVLAAVLIMGVAIDHISQAFDHIDVDRLRQLKG